MYNSNRNGNGIPKLSLKEWRELARSKGLSCYSRLRKSDLMHMIGKCDTEVFGNDFLIEVSEDDCEDLPDGW